MKFLYNKTVTDVLGAIIAVTIFWIAVQIFTDFDMNAEVDTPKNSTEIVVEKNKN